MNLEELKKPIPYKWKIQTVSKIKPTAQCVAYIDARDVMDVLDKVCGAGNWQDTYQFVGDKLIAGIAINVSEKPEKTRWITKFDTGTAGDIEGEKSIFSDAFKRAAVKWGVGRFLYDLEFKWVTTDKPGQGAVPVDEKGQRIWDLTKHFRNSATLPTPPKQTTVKEEDNEFKDVKCKDCGGDIGISLKGSPYCKNKCWLPENSHFREEFKKLHNTTVEEIVIPDEMPF